MITEIVEKFILNNRGAACEVMSSENELLYVGFVGIYERREGIVQIGLRRGKETPQGYEFDTPVKIKITPLREKGHSLLFGSVFRCDRDFWFIKPEKLMRYEENREVFRQHVDLVGRISTGKGEPEELCRLQDISQTGVCFVSSHHYEVGEKVKLSDIQIRENGQIYHFLCQIVRVQKMEGPEPSDKKRNPIVEWKYGCRFVDMEKKEQNMLGRDILYLQAQSLN
ncbi:MAG TPA: PilZ domain-containing protein [Candidatus Eisenbergiella merdipullorum]|uniref:PilZ domain-containing protein n=1 Tax=Candidatus Eisenbergiella merdipullorum TaxID=2838553 RepID=A0A9D2I7Z3_9FIRM|nr:PilZ domain-containing protein [Candidatus Eisenbergiella merdipullorum]